MLDRTIAPPVSPIGDLKLPITNVLTLENGLQIRHYRMPNSGLCQISVFVRGGQYEGRVRAVATLLAATITEGASGMSSAQVAEQIDFYGARLNAEQYVHWTGVTLKVLSSKLPNLLPLLCDILEHPDFDSDVVENARDREAKALIHSMSQVAYLAQTAMAPLLMGADNPYARELTVEDINSVTADELRHFHDKYYKACNMQVLFFGEFSDEDLKLVADAMGQLPTMPEASPLVPVRYRPQSPQRVFVTKEDAQQNAVRMALPSIDYANPDYLKLKLAVFALGGYFGSRLVKNIREDKGYTYGINAFMISQQKNSAIIVSAQCDRKYVEDVIRETGLEMRRMGAELIPDDEMVRIKQFMASMMMETVDNAFSLANYYRGAIVTDLPLQDFDEQIELLRVITPEYIQEIACRYFDPAAFRITIAGRP